MKDQNYKTSTIIFTSILYLSQYIYYYHSVDGNSCSDFQNIIDNQIGCQLHDTPMDLNEYRANITDSAIHLIPDVAMVKRCGGNCDYPSHRCVPKRKAIKSIPVMAILSQYPHGIHGQQCGNLQIEEHLECHCNCPITAEECTSQPNVDKRFDEGTCRCLCTDTAARSQCISRGMNWDDTNCRCVCPISLWRFCSTGYVFDYENTCHCIPTSMTASLGLIAAIIVLTTCMLGTAVGGFIMYRKQTGIFKKRRSLHSTLMQDRRGNPLLKEAFANENMSKNENSSVIRGATAKFISENSSATAPPAQSQSIYISS